MPIKAVLFDLDGTLRDTRDVIYDSLRQGVQQVGGPLLSNEDMKEVVQHHSKVHAKYAAHVSSETFNDAYFKELFSRLPEVKLYQNARQVVQQLHDSGIKIAIVSSAAPDEINEFLKRLQNDGYIDVVVGDDGQTARKPSPEPLLLALKKLDISAEHSVMVGDMSVDMEAATAAGVPAIGITHGFEDEVTLTAAGAQQIIHNLDQLLASVKSL